MVKVIGSRIDYESALAQVEQLLEQNPPTGSDEANRLDLLLLVIEDYEGRESAITLPDPIDAIQFRMEQADLKPRDLIPFIGSRSKVSEVLARKRPLTLSMMRALHQLLGIPAEVFLAATQRTTLDQESIDWGRFPLKEMERRGWLARFMEEAQGDLELAVRDWFRSVAPAPERMVLLRRSQQVRAAKSMDEVALTAWTVRVIQKADEDKPTAKYLEGCIDKDFIQSVARLSWSENGPRLAQEYLRNHGIALVVEPHLPRTRLDGAAIINDRQMPIIGLTIRHDRLDNFWFCLAHELAHIALHMSGDANCFYDDIDAEDTGDPREQEADTLAREALIPAHIWKESSASQLRSAQAAQDLAKKLQVHPSIVAGRIRFEFKSYNILGNLVGHRKVRVCFPEINW